MVVRDIGCSSVLATEIRIVLAGYCMLQADDVATLDQVYVFCLILGEETHQKPRIVARYRDDQIRRVHGNRLLHPDTVPGAWRFDPDILVVLHPVVAHARRVQGLNKELGAGGWAVGLSVRVLQNQRG